MPQDARTPCISHATTRTPPGRARTPGRTPPSGLLGGPYPAAGRVVALDPIEKAINRVALPLPAQGARRASENLKEQSTPESVTPLWQVGRKVTVKSHLSRRIGRLYGNNTHGSPHVGVCPIPLHWL